MLVKAFLEALSFLPVFKSQGVITSTAKIKSGFKITSITENSKISYALCIVGKGTST